MIDEAAHLFARHGYAKTSVREIVEATGATKPTLYYYFGSKAGLFKATIDFHMDAWGKGLQCLVAMTDIPAMTRLRHYFQEGINVASNTPHVMMLIMRAHLDASEGAPMVDLDAHRQREKALLGELIQQGIQSGVLKPHDIDDSICALMGMLHFRISEILVGETPKSDTVDRIIDTFLHGVAA